MAQKNNSFINFLGRIFGGIFIRKKGQYYSIVKAIASDSELIDFVTEFLGLSDWKNRRFTNIEYSSDLEKYKIQYLDFIPNDSGDNSRNPARIYSSEFCIQLGKKQCAGLSTKQVMFVILHLFILNSLESFGEKVSPITADEITINVMSKIGHPIKLTEMIALFESYPRQQVI